MLRNVKKIDILKLFWSRYITPRYLFILYNTVPVSLFLCKFFFVIFNETEINGYREAQVQEPLNLDELTKDLCGLKDGHWEKNLTFDLSLISSQRHRILNKWE